MAEWIVLTLCIISCLVLIGVGYMIRTYRKGQSFNSRIINEGVILEPLEPSPYIGVYDEVDENALTFAMTDLNVASAESHYETVDCVSQERLSFTTSTEHGDTGYLDPYFAMEEDENHQLQDRTSQKECSSTNSSSSDVVAQDNTSCHNLYQPLHENWQDDSRGYEVPVMVHKCFEQPTGFDEHAISNSYFNVNKPLQKDWEMKIATYENQQFHETKAGNDKRLQADDFSSVLKTGNLHDYININDESNILMNNCDTMESWKPFDQDKSETIEQKSFCGDFDSTAESVNTCSNNVCCFQDDYNSNLNAYDDAKSCNI
ncbi:unnamed protein product [Mytilus coruscus]|uniref:Uncharacterized protein n=1 Tax=Mytilus coruscus TaxID=42192 RepID=A0A6J8BK22_MYTCO|nr:unnamed protein product [Mytilus coruscus]